MLTEKQENLYDEYMTQVAVLQKQAIKAIEEALIWHYPYLSRDEIRNGVMKRSQIVEDVVNTTDLVELSNLIEDQQDYVNESMMKKLSENL